MTARKLAFAAASAAALVIAGAGAAIAATSGTMSVSTDGAKVTSATYNFAYSGCQRSNRTYDAYLKGSFAVSTATDHLNAKVDGYGWTKIVQANAAKAYAFSVCIGPSGDMVYHNSVALQACREHWYGDNCSATTKRR